MRFHAIDNDWTVTFDDGCYFTRDGCEFPQFRVRSGIMEVSHVAEEMSGSVITWRVGGAQNTFNAHFPIPMRIYLRSPDQH